jgi:hypothetical protein
MLQVWFIGLLVISKERDITPLRNVDELLPDNTLSHPRWCLYSLCMKNVFLSTFLQLPLIAAGRTHQNLHVHCCSLVAAFPLHCSPLITVSYILWYWERKALPRTAPDSWKLWPYIYLYSENVTNITHIHALLGALTLAVPSQNCSETVNLRDSW